MWDDILTDTDGPYIELMVGAYSDNQPDYSWLQPGETRSFVMNWYPFRDIEGVKNANLEAAVNLDVAGGQARFGFCTTKDFPSATVRLEANGNVLLEEQVAINPAKPYAKQTAVPPGVDPHTVRASLSANGRELVAYSPVRLDKVAQPPIYTPPPAPADIKNGEELFLAGQRADQFHSPSLDADPFWEELLRRDPGDIEANTGMGRLALRRARFADAERYFRTALERLTASYTTPKNAEPLYYLGLALKAQERNDEAFDAFYKATWSQEWKSPAYLALAEIAASRGDFTATLGFADRSLEANALNLRAYGLKAAALRHLGRADAERDVVAVGMRLCDPLDPRLAAEAWLAGSREDAAALFATLNNHPANAQEIAAEFANAGLWRDGMDVLKQAVAAAPNAAKV
jgi:tetratricopeptide (TPR) repeat protein